ncbi:hypothetical protein ACSBR1_010463 [Camellia fascicularis]
MEGVKDYIPYCFRDHKAATFRLVEPFKLSEPTQAAIANGVAGMAAAVCSQAVFVPIDVVC